MEGKQKKSFHSLSKDIQFIDNYMKNGFFIISAYIPECSNEENKSNHKKLCKLIHSQNLKFIEIVGHWEDKKEKSSSNSEERFLFVPSNDIAIQNDLLALSMFLMTHFKQETIIYYDPDSAILLYNRDHVSEIPEFNFNNIHEIFFRNKRRNSDSKFVIDGRVIPNEFWGTSILDRRGYIF